jgi:hypothetical protein
MDDLVWTNHVSQEKGKQKTSMLVVILWDRLQDFIAGEQQHPQFPCNFTKEIVRVNLPHSLRTSRAHSPAIVLRYELLSTLKLHPHVVFFMFCSSQCALQKKSNIYVIIKISLFYMCVMRIHLHAVRAA